MRRLLIALPLLACQDYDLVLHEGTDVWHQNPWEAVDIMMVVDNSCSMKPYQDKLAADFDLFFQYFADGGVDYRMAVVTTDAQDPEFGIIRGPIIDSDSLNPAERFAEAVTVGTSGGGYELGLEAARVALTTSANGNFVREEASLSVIFVSDEQDASPGEVSWYIDELRDVKGQREREAFTGSALTVTDPGACTPEQFALSTRGTRYVETALHTSAVSANLCAEDFGPIVTELALNTSAMRADFFLSEFPSPATLEVSVDEDMLPCEDGGWTYTLVPVEGRDVPAIIFAADVLPRSNARIVARYQYGNGDPDAFCPAP
jgi:hypothetical protein